MTHFETIAAILAMTSVILVMVVAAQGGCPLHHFDIAEAFVRAKMDVEVCMKLQERSDTFTGNTVRLHRTMYGV